MQSKLRITYYKLGLLVILVIPLAKKVLWTLLTLQSSIFFRHIFPIIYTNIERFIELINVLNVFNFRYSFNSYSFNPYRSKNYNAPCENIGGVGLWAVCSDRKIITDNRGKQYRKPLRFRGKPFFSFLIPKSKSYCDRTRRHNDRFVSILRDKSLDDASS